MNQAQDDGETQKLRDQLASMRVATWDIRRALERAVPYIRAQAHNGDEAAERQLRAALSALASFGGEMPAPKEARP